MTGQDSDANQGNSSPDEPDPLKASPGFYLAAITQAIEQLGSVDTESLRRDLQRLGQPDAEAIRRSFEALARLPSMSSLGAQTVAPKELVPEESGTDDDLDVDAPSNVGSDNGPSTRDRGDGVERFKAIGVQARSLGDGPGSAVELELPAGRSHRVIRVRSEDQETLLTDQVQTWRSLERYNGIWSEAHGVVEVALRVERFGPPLGWMLERLTGEKVERGAAEPVRKVLPGPTTGVSLTIGASSELASILLSHGRPTIGRLPRVISMRVAGLTVATTEQADSLVEQFGDSIGFACSLNLGFLVHLQRLEDRDSVARNRRRGERMPLSFPLTRYPHVPVLLYQAGRDRATSPLIRYWALYQVLEYFFPKFTRLEASGAVSRRLRSPSFNAHSDEEVLSLLDLASSFPATSGAERDQLEVTIRHLASSEELRSFIEEVDLHNQLTDRKSELTSKTVNVRHQPADVHADLTQRVYDIRCRIVHSKSSGMRLANGPGLIPGTHHDDLVVGELPLIEYLAEQAIISAGEPLVLP